jgi:signal transduction histidine kinase
MSNLKFRVSSALKDIIGRDLITDDYIAVFELVKNSYDAHATKVEITFQNIYGKSPKILIKDNGKGMDYDELKNKWLFVAYSAKKDGTEDLDYRGKINQNKVYAGAKGIGRFSCDRLGKKLKIETTKKGHRTEVLITDWEQFEKNLKEEFVDVEVEHTWKKENSYSITHGTVLEITELRSEWDRDKLHDLKNSLSKLISPSKNGKDKFQIYLVVEEELEADNDEAEDRDKINGPVQNFIFETLGLKTTKISASISDDGQIFTTELIDGGTSIYKIKEKNDFSLLKGINVTLYYLNRSAKVTFSKSMGLPSRKYGHVFLYKNGFRIYPFGVPNEDPLRIDVRKKDKIYSRLGTDELIGQMEIWGNNPELKETSSRGNGLIINATYGELTEAFWVVLARLEKYVIDVQEWGISIEDKLDEYDGLKLKSKITSLIEKLTDVEDAENIIDFQYNSDIIDILQNAQGNSATVVLDNLKRIAAKSGNDQLVAETKRIEGKLGHLKAAKEEAERVAKTAEKELQEKDSQNLFLKSLKSQELNDVLNLMHHIGISTSTIQNFIRGVVFQIDSEMPLDRNELKGVLSKISVEINKIYSISRFATKANFKVSVKPAKTDLKEFFREYLNNVVAPFLPATTKLKVHTDDTEPFFMEVKPLEMTILADNLINNSKKANAKNIKVSIETDSKNVLKIEFKDDGKGILDADRKRIFEYGFTTTDGSGLGLTHVKDILEGMGSTIELEPGAKNGAVFIVKFKRFQ